MWAGRLFPSSVTVFEGFFITHFHMHNFNINVELCTIFRAKQFP